MNKKAVAAMSGGVDSTVAAYLAQKQGYDCIGVTMKLFDNESIGVSRSKTCCSADDAEDARSAAYKLGIRFSHAECSANRRYGVQPHRAMGGYFR